MVRSMLRHLSGNTTLRFTALSRWKLSTFVVIKHFRWKSLHLEPSCCLDVLVYMLNWVFWWDILLEIDLKCWAQNGYVQRYHPWALRRLLTPKKKQKRGEFKTPPRPTGRRSNNLFSYLILLTDLKKCGSRIQWSPRKCEFVVQIWWEFGINLE